MAAPDHTPLSPAVYIAAGFNLLMFAWSLSASLTQAGFFGLHPHDMLGTDFPALMILLFWAMGDVLIYLIFRANQRS